MKLSLIKYLEIITRKFVMISFMGYRLIVFFVLFYIINMIMRGTIWEIIPLEVVSFLNEMYTKFDCALENHKVYKVNLSRNLFFLFFLNFVSKN
jgi:hypothetical protein